MLEKAEEPLDLTNPDTNCACISLPSATHRSVAVNLPTVVESVERKNPWCVSMAVNFRGQAERSAKGSAKHSASIEISRSPEKSCVLSWLSQVLSRALNGCHGPICSRIRRGVDAIKPYVFCLVSSAAFRAAAKTAG